MDSPKVVVNQNLVSEYASFKFGMTHVKLIRRGEYLVMTTQTRYAEGIQITGPITPEFAEILTYLP
jgi:hypothetical protein